MHAQTDLAMAERKQRFALRLAALALAQFLAYICVTAFTPWLDEVAASGLSYAYYFGFFQFVIALGLAHVYLAYSNRLEASRDAQGVSA